MKLLIEQLDLPSKISPLHIPGLTDEIQLWVKREDQIHPFVSGNKWRKLKFYLRDVMDQKFPGVVSMGGPFSNHLCALASAGYQLKVNTVGIIPGQNHDPSNPTLQFLQSRNMDLHFVSRADFHAGWESPVVQAILKDYSNFSLIPFGGSGPPAFPGLQELSREIARQLPRIPDYLICACGTGMTAAGLLRYSDPSTECIAISVVRDKLIEAKILSWSGANSKGKLKLMEDFHFGGIGKFNPSLVQFVNDFWRDQSIALDMVYTGKAFYGLISLLKRKHFKEGSTVLIIHTGGLQGNRGFNYLHPGLLNPSLAPP